MTDSQRGAQHQTRQEEMQATRLKNRFAWLNRFTDEELQKITLCEQDDQLEADEEYFDLNRPEQGMVRGVAGGRVPRDSCLVPRSKVTPETWAKLTSLAR